MESDMASLARWMTAVMTFIDAVGTYKPSPEQKKRAEKVRTPSCGKSPYQLVHLQMPFASYCKGLQQLPSLAAH